MFNLSFLCFLILNLTFYFSILRFFYFLREKFSFIDRLVCGFLIYLTSILGIFALSGFIHIYEFKTVLIFLLILLLFFSIYKFRIKESFTYTYHEIKDLFKILVLLLKKDRLFLILFLIIFFEFILLLRFTLLYPPQGWDSYVYHLPIVSRIVLEKGVLPINFLNLHPHMYFPKNVEILFSYYYLFTNTDKGMLVIHFPFLIFGVLSVYSVLRKLNIPREKSIYIISILSMPIIPNQAGCAYIDIECGSIFLIFLNLLLLKFPYNIFFPAISLSIGAGSKLSFLPIFSLFLIYGIVVLILKRRKILLLIMLFLCLITSFHNYLYNFYLTRNPLYPYSIKISRMEIFKGDIDVPKQVDYFPTFTYNPFIILKCLLEFSDEKNEHYIYDNRMGGFGHLFISLGLIPFFLSIFLSIKNREKKFLKVLFFTFLFYLTGPYRWWPRFHIYLPFVAFIGTLHIWERYKQENVKKLITLFTFFSFIEGIHGRIILTPYSSLFSYDNNAFDIFYTPPEIKTGYYKLYFYIQKYDKIGIWNLSSTPYILLGLILRNNFLIYLDKVEKEEDLKYYQKVITSPLIRIKDFKKVYEDKNICLWIK